MKVSSAVVSIVKVYALGNLEKLNIEKFMRNKMHLISLNRHIAAKLELEIFDKAPSEVNLFPFKYLTCQGAI